MIAQVLFCTATWAAEPEPLLRVTFDETDGTAITPGPPGPAPIDYRAADGTASDYLRPGMAGKALYVPADAPVHAVIGIDHLPPLSQPLTITAWVHPKSNRRHMIVDAAMSNADSPDTGYRLYLDYFFRLRVEVSTKNRHTTLITDKYAVPNGYWSHVAAVVRPDLLTLYVNAVKVAQKRIIPPLARIRQTPDVCIGTHRHKFAFPFQGRIDDVWIFRGALTERQILEVAMQAVEQTTP